MPTRPHGGNDAPETLAWETQGTEIDYTCPGFDVRRDDVRLPDGTETDFHYVDEPPAVVILPFASGGGGDDGGDAEGDDVDAESGDVVVIEEWRQAVGRVNLGLPAGSTEPEDEDLAEAARRELREETGYEATEMEPLFVVEPSNGLANSVHHYFVARGCEPSAEQTLDFNESIRARTMGYDDLLAAVLDGEIRDGRTALGVLRYELSRR